MFWQQLHVAITCATDVVAGVLQHGSQVTVETLGLAIGHPSNQATHVAQRNRCCHRSPPMETLGLAIDHPGDSCCTARQTMSQDCATDVAPMQQSGDCGDSQIGRRPPNQIGQHMLQNGAMQCHCRDPLMQSANCGHSQIHRRAQHHIVAGDWRGSQGTLDTPKLAHCHDATA